MIVQADTDGADHYVVRQAEPDEDEQRTIWLDLYGVKDDGSRDTMMEIVIQIALDQIGFENLRELIAQSDWSAFGFHRP